jgi:hypothetical protein
MYVHALGITGREDGLQRLANPYRFGRALRATIPEGTSKPLPTDGFDEAIVRRFAVRPFQEILPDEAERANLKAVAMAVQPFYQARFAEIRSVDPERWYMVEDQLTTQLSKRGVRWKPDPSESPLRVGFALRAMEEAFDLPAGTVPPDGG